MTSYVGCLFLSLCGVLLTLAVGSFGASRAVWDYSVNRKREAYVGAVLVFLSVSLALASFVAFIFIR